MSWLDLLEGFPLVLFYPKAAIFLWAAKGCPYWQSIILPICWTSITLLATYYGTAILINYLKKWWVTRVLIEKWEKEVVVRRNNFRHENNNSFSHKTHHWLKFQKRWVVILLAFIPYTHLVPGFGTALIMTTKFLNLKHGALFLLAANAFCWSVISYHIYQGVGFFLL